MRGVYVCDGCEKVYVRALKKPVAGKSIFVPIGKRGSKEPITDAKAGHKEVNFELS